MAPLLALVSSLGVLAVALGNNAARGGSDEAQPLFWAGLVVIFAPITVRLLSVGASRAERLALAALLGGALFAVKVVYSPTGFILHDELATWRGVSDLLQSGHAFVANPLVGGYAGFPGLGLVTAAIARLADLGIFAAGTIVIAIARVSLMVLLFAFFERASGSARLAGIAIAIYACNPSFLYFDSQFGYESLALAVAAALLLVALRWTDVRPGDRHRNRVGMVAAMAILACALAITHHMTTYAVFAFLAVWALVAGVWAAAPERHSAARRGWLDGPALPALLLGAVGAAWFAFVAGELTTAELGGALTDALRSVIDLAFGDSGSKTLFQSAGQTNTTAARILGAASIIPLLALIPLGILRTWRRNSPPLWRALAVVAALYPATLLLRLTQAGTETSQRASEFVFVGLAFVGGLLIGELAWPRKRARRVAASAAMTALATVVFLGGFIVGEAPVTRQPGPFLVGAEARSITPQGVAAARFVASVLPAGSRVIVDRPNSTLLGSYGQLDYVTGSVDGIAVSRVFLSKTFDAIDRKVIIEDAIDYIVVDRRLSHEVPIGGFYFDADEPSAHRYRKPIDAAMLRKFNHARGLSRIFDNGAIAIYDTAGLRSK